MEGEGSFSNKVAPESKFSKKSRATRVTLNNSLSMVLRGGVILSALVIGLGLSLFLFSGKSGYSMNSTEVNKAATYITFHASELGSNSKELYFPTDLAEIWQGVIYLKPFAIIMLGLTFLIATPVLNVALAGFGFIKEHNWAFSLISLFVLAILILSFFLGKAGG
jgi:uncharacterized membrane protein